MKGDKAERRQILVDDGLLVIDKPRGPSSHQVTAWAGEILGAKVGHAGTLDPGVSGVLTVMIGKAVRLAPILLSEEKEYVCLFRLHGDVAISNVEAALAEFTGRIYQRPPRKSAVSRNLRIRMVHGIELLDHEGRQYLVRVRCDAGTYIRSLCHHLGMALGTDGHMVELRRTRSGPFGEGHAHTLQELTDAVAAATAGDSSRLQEMVRSPGEALGDLPKVILRDTAVDAVCPGAVLARAGIRRHDAFDRGAQVVLLSTRGELVALGRSLVSSKEAESLQHGFVIASHTVFMDPGTYQRGWKKGHPQDSREHGEKDSIKKNT
jgi:predicted rRNA pseudouridine synthase